MKNPIFAELGRQIREAGLGRALTQPALASRLGRDPARISELERDLLKGRLGRDRLTLLAEICDALDLVPMLIPRAKAGLVSGLAAIPVSIDSRGPAVTLPPGRAFDDVFVDLSDNEEER